MKVETIVEIVEKLIGDVEAWGETRHDEEAYKNLNVMIGVCESLILDIYRASKTKDRGEYSMKRIGERAYEYLQKELPEWVEEIEG